MFGSYYQAQKFDPISAFGAVSGQASLAHEAIIEFLAGPIGRFAPWGEQTLNGWQEIVKPEYNYSIFPINAQTLTLTEQRAFGNPVGVIGIMFRTPVPMSVVDELFTQGPYEAFAGYVVYRLDDQKRLPTAEFLYLGKLADEGRTDGMGSYDALDRAVKRAGGVLVYVLPEGRSGAERDVPAGMLEAAVAETMGVQPLVAPAPAPVPLLPAPNSPSATTVQEFQQSPTPIPLPGTAPTDLSTRPVPPRVATAMLTSTAVLEPGTSSGPLEPDPVLEPVAPSAGGSSSGGMWALAAVGLIGGAALGYFLVRRRR